MSGEARDGFPVVDESGMGVGDFCSADLLKAGVASYIDLLTDDGFLTNFEPFEQYYEQENTTTVAELMTKDILTMAPQTPVIRIGSFEADIVTSGQTDWLCKRPQR